MAGGVFFVLVYLLSLWLTLGVKLFWKIISLKEGNVILILKLQMAITCVFEKRLKEIDLIIIASAKGTFLRMEYIFVHYLSTI